MGFRARPRRLGYGRHRCSIPNAPVSISWYNGNAEGFVENSRKMFGHIKPETRSKHWFGNDRLTLNGTRALLETDIEVRARDNIDGVLFDFTYEGRFFDRFEKRDGAWKIAQWTCLYDSDRVAPAVPGTIPPGFFDGARDRAASRAASPICASARRR